MKILYVLNSGSYGGMEQHVLTLALGMADKGHEVHVWGMAGLLSDAFTNSKVVFSIKPIKQDIDISYIFHLSKYLVKNKIEVLHAHEVKAVANSLIAGTIAGTKVRISHTHTPISEWQINVFKKKLNIFVNSLLVNLFSHREIALTESKKDIKIREGISRRKLAVLSSANPLESKDFDFSLEEKTVYKQEILAKYKIDKANFIWGFVNRITEEKGHVVLIEGFKLFLDSLALEERAKHTLLLAGGGRSEGACNQKIIDYNLSQNVVITGVFSKEDHKKFYASLHAFIHPSLAEGFGIALLEAMATGIPIIASDLSVFKEIAEDSISYFKKGDPHDLKEKMLQLRGDYTKYLLKAKISQELVRLRYSVDSFINEYEAFYFKLLRR